MTLPELVQKVGEAARKDPRQVVNLRADRAVSYGRVMGILGEMKKAGLQDFSLAVTTGETHGKP